MSEIRNGNIKKQVDLIEKQQTQMKTMLEQVKSKCIHKKGGDLDIVPAHNRQNGELKYICRKCKKEINLKKISDDELRASCDCVDRAIDVIKLQLDPANRPEDEAILKRCAKTQYRVRNEIMKLYAASLKKNNKGKGNRNNTNDYDSSWNKPVVNR